MNKLIRLQMQTMVTTAQDTICRALTNLDGSTFIEDIWQRPQGGGGNTRVLQDGRVFEKAGVNTSVVYGDLVGAAAAAMRKRLSGTHSTDIDTDPSQALSFFATGLSLVIHPRNPMAPTAHANYRYFELWQNNQLKSWWFGGGSDLTPVYLFDEDARHFHTTLKTVCDHYDQTYFPRFKVECDQYFYLPHRQETRGIGGIFFDDLADRSADELVQFCTACAAAFIPSYLPLVESRHQLPFDDHHRRWQLLRRGRYVEFNLLYDRGTTFGLHSNGRVESILMSLPLTARWEYDATVAPNSAEDRLQQVLKHPRSWI